MGAEDRLCTVSSTDFDACCGEAVFRSAIPCDEDVYQLCVNIMGRDQFQPLNNYSDAVELYFHLRRSIQALL